MRGDGKDREAVDWVWSMEAQGVAGLEVSSEGPATKVQPRESDEKGSESEKKESWCLDEGEAHLAIGSVVSLGSVIGLHDELGPEYQDAGPSEKAMGKLEGIVVVRAEFWIAEETDQCKQDNKYPCQNERRDK